MSQAIGIDAPGLQFGMLGTLQVTRSGKPLPLGGRQQRAVLASLLVEADTVVSLRRLADALWGEHTPPSAVITVQTYISRLQEILEPERVRGTPAVAR
jgi:DNA-binding SARP family transcriptional activator